VVALNHSLLKVIILKGLSLVILLSIHFVPSLAQSLDNLVQQKPFAISGGISANQIFYSSQGIASRRAPSSYYATGNLNGVQEVSTEVLKCFVREIIK
jgi:hypothetical protein